MDAQIYTLMRAHILQMIGEEADPDGTIALKPQRIMRWRPES
jgi:hypothetical protein